MVAEPNTPSRKNIAQTPAQCLGEIKDELIRDAKLKYIVGLASCLSVDDVEPNVHLLNTVVDAYTRGYTDCMKEWYSTLKDMDCCLPENRGK